MPVSDPSLAAQLVARGEETRFFDDIGCVRDFLSRHPRPAGSAIFVADHRTRAWVPAEKAVYTRARIETPMGSRLIAHADVASRDSDPAAAGGETVPAAQALGGAAAPGSRSGEGA
jgi:copper chaperone NosL